MNSYKRKLWAAATAASITPIVCIWYFRPLANSNSDINGPIRHGWMSKYSIADSRSGRLMPFLYDIGRHAIIFTTVNVTRLYLNMFGDIKLKTDDHYFHFIKNVTNRSLETPLLTVSNHRSLLDDPPLFSCILPYWLNIQPRYNRFNLCSQEYCFNDKIPSILQACMAAGNTLPIHRGGGINQKLFLDFAR